MPMPLASTDAPPSAKQVTSALRSLARRGVVAVKRSNQIQLFQIGGTGQSQAKDIGTISRPVWQRVLQAGWIVPDEQIEGWRLSNAGRIALKRMLSRSGEPGHTKPVECSDTIQSQSAALPPRLERSRSRASATSAGFNDCESPLGWLRRRRDRSGRPLISEGQFQAGERLRRDFTRGSMTPSVTSHYSPVLSGSGHCSGSDHELELRDDQLRARNRFRDALQEVGPEFASVLVDVCCHLKGLEEVERSSGWPRRSAKVVLLMALNSLARHYRLPV
ncbi:MAG: hypothetical protein K0U74_12635 [Alphaproteobacteria bacterium]|nr:hypothetical protein [Alphaproteobacteria bacterium]